LKTGKSPEQLAGDFAFRRAGAASRVALGQIGSAESLLRIAKGGSTKFFSLQ
jgi:hypothetical protein